MNIQITSFLASSLKFLVTYNLPAAYSILFNTKFEHVIANDCDVAAPE